jgi:hypothetical protein
MTKVTALGAIAIPVFTLVMLVFHGAVEPVFGLFYLVPDLWEISQFEWGSIFIDDVLEGNAIKTQIAIVQIKSFLGEVIGLLNEVKITVLHSIGRVTGDI